MLFDTGGKMEKIEGKVAVVTGSGRGIGKAVACLFAREGAAVVVNDIDEAPAMETVKVIREMGGEALACVADISKSEGARKVIETAAEDFGGLDILVNNAGITRSAPVDIMTDDQWDTCMDVNLKGTFNCIRAASRFMMKPDHGGRIINISSVDALIGPEGQLNYNAAKAGIIALTKTIAREWAKYDVTCNAVALGWVHTRMSGEIETGEEVFGQKMGIPKNLRDKLLKRGGFKIMTPEDAAKPILFLASSDAAFITGTLLNVSGGMHI
jgi:3-oxoacyl-[acyl-carrier protein] reductase